MFASGQSALGTAAFGLEPTLSGAQGRALQERRALWLGISYLLLALVATLLWPLGVLALSPIVFGIPHLVGDARYLLVKPGYHRQRLRLLFVALALLACAAGAGSIAGCIAVVFAVTLTQGVWLRRVALLLPALLLLTAALSFRRTTELVFAHAHNGVALLWLLGRFGHAPQRLGLALAFAASVALLWWLPLESVLWPTSLGGMDLGYHLRALAPVDAPEWGVRLVLVFAFAQLFHYAVWIQLVPVLAREPGSRFAFGASYRALVRELGRWSVWAVVFAVLALGVAACWSLRDARELYLRFAIFHGYFELAFMAIAWLEGSAAAVREKVSA
jgi:hypothetical protein